VEAVAFEQIALYREGTRFRWIHQSLRDYLAGQWLADAASAPNGALHKWPSWRDGALREAVLFGLVILSERQDVEEALRAAIRLDENAAPDEDTIRFLIEALRMGIRLRPDLVDQILDAALFLGLELKDERVGLGSGRKCWTLFAPPHPFDLLIQICGVMPSAREKLMDLIARHDIPRDMRLYLAQGLGRTLAEEKRAP
jgi:hypothetical protein